jgi:hypothetical protein
VTGSIRGNIFHHTRFPRGKREAERRKSHRIMQLMTFNSLLMFDIVFIFFLFLIAVTCLMYYLPPPKKIKKRNSKSHLDNRGASSSVNNNQTVITVASSNSSKSVLFVNGDNEPIESFTKCCKYCEKCKLIYEEIYSDRSYATASKVSSSGSYLKAKECDVKNCKGPIYEV